MINIAIMGFGIVGSGVVEVIQKNASLIEERVNEPVHLKYILDIKDFPDSPFSSLVIHDFSVIEQDPDITIIVETIGGTTAAKEYTQRALRAGKSIVTSNKELVAKHGYELMSLAKEQGVSYLYEASVGGGIPIIHPLKQCLAANEITEICGILNGTTNYILTRMSHSALSLEEALQEAQCNGYAEVDPSADVEGLDACRKICILAALAFGRQIDLDKVHTEGITQITPADIACADSCGRRIKLLGQASLLPSGKLQVYVSPHLVKKEAPLGGVEDVYNAISVRGNAIGDVMFYGRGAGKLPTASAVVADIMEVIGNRGTPQRLDWDKEEPELLVPYEAIKKRWYVRMQGEAALLRERFDTIEMIHCQASTRGETAFLTSPVSYSNLKDKLQDLSVQSIIPLLDD